MKQKILFTFIMTSLLTGCDREPTHDVQYYLDHPEERIAKLKECRNNPGEKASTPNCQNAGEAESQAMFKSTKMPTIE